MEGFEPPPANSASAEGLNPPHPRKFSCCLCIPAGISRALPGTGEGPHASIPAWPQAKASSRLSVLAAQLPLLSPNPSWLCGQGQRGAEPQALAGSPPCAFPSQTSKSEPGRASRMQNCTDSALLEWHQQTPQGSAGLYLQDSTPSLTKPWDSSPCSFRGTEHPQSCPCPRGNAENPVHPLRRGSVVQTNPQQGKQNLQEKRL